MAYNIHEYYRNVAQIGRQLAGVNHENWRSSEEEIWIIGITNGIPGYVITAKPFLAAECIENKTHRLCTEAEVAGELQRRADERVRIIDEDREMKGKNAPPPSPEMKTMLEFIVSTLASQQAAVMSAQKPSKGAN